MLLQRLMLASFIALSLAFTPADLDISPRRVVEAAAPVTSDSAKPVASPEGWSTPPMVSADGRTARLLTNEQLERLHAIDEELATFNTTPSRFLGVIGGIAASTPVIYATVVAVALVVELANLSALTLVFSMFTFPIGFIAGLMAVPVWGWVVAAIGVGVAIGAAAITSNLERHRDALLAERRALLDSTKPAPLDATSLVTVGTF